MSDQDAIDEMLAEKVQEVIELCQANGRDDVAALIAGAGMGLADPAIAELLYMALYPIVESIRRTITAERN